MRNPIKSRKCFCCGSRFCLADHHIQPRQAGGLNETRNLITLCCTCHDAVEGQQEGPSAGDIWLNILKRKESFHQESAGRRQYRLSREQAQQCPAYISVQEKRRLAAENRRGVLSTMGVEEYFEQPDTPRPNSPVGLLIARLRAKNPGMHCEQARQEAHGLLAKAAGRRVYRVPAVLSPEEQAAERARLLAAFSQSRTIKTVPQNYRASRFQFPGSTDLGELEQTRV